MKKLLAILILLIFSFQSYSQIWTEDNAVWHYDFSNWWNVGYYKIEYVGDTVVGGYLAEDLHITRTLFNYFTDQFGDDTLIYVGVGNVGHEYVYHNDDSLMRWDNGAYRLLLDFSAQVGDEYLIKVDSNPWDQTCRDSSYIKVTGVGYESIGGVNYRYIDLQPTDSSPFYLMGRYSERYGGDGYLFPQPKDCFGGVTEWDIIYFRCFEDDSLSYLPVSNDCEYWMTQYTLGSEEKMLSTLTIAPNPTNGIVQFSGVNINKVDIVSVSGSNAITMKVKGTQTIDISNLESGTYIIKCISDNDVMFVKRLTIQ